tara:strand:+ start:581 stop:1261 length:681 start_codon:yes stop_codon:yes gene_type:complete
MDTMTNEGNKQYLEALKKLREELPHVETKADGYNYKYATIEDLLRAWEPIFSKNGFVLQQFTKSGDNGVYDIIGSRLTHVETGLSEESTLTLPVSNDWQQQGSGVTYFKRYTLVAVGKPPVGEDWDGLTTPPAPPKKARETEKKAPKKKASAEKGAVEIAKEALDAKVIPDLGLVKEAKTIEGLRDLFTKNKEEYEALGDKVFAVVRKEFNDRKHELKKGATNGTA